MDEKIHELLNRLDTHLVSIDKKIDNVDHKLDNVKSELKQDILRVEEKLNYIDKVNTHVTRDIYMLKNTK